MDVTQLLEGNIVYYASILQSLTLNQIWYMSKTDETIAEAVPITKTSLKACGFEPNAVDTCYTLEVAEGKDIKIHFEDGTQYNRITFTKLNPTYSNLWYIKDIIALHELQNLSKFMLGYMFKLKQEQ